MYVARDKDGILHCFEKKPIKTIYAWYSPSGPISFPILFIS